MDKNDFMCALTLRQGKPILVGKRFIYQLVIDVYHTRMVFVTFVILINGHILDQFNAHLTGKFHCSRIAFQAADKLRNIFFVLFFGSRTGCHFIILGFQRFLFRLIFVEHIKSHVGSYPDCNLILINALNELVKLCKAISDCFHTLGIGDIPNVNICSLSFEKFCGRSLFHLWQVYTSLEYSKE